ncbi:MULTISPECIES: hypothetical protein [Microbacterium]|uniref:hypothetical protein n=1 Tax=Microbacterium TaxID=33882 RepID=UPI00126A2835|nr:MULTISPECIES: hypothetical protein [Microbacterium]MCE7481637.1 hypothetical protein [Microbacterium profundi]
MKAKIFLEPDAEVARLAVDLQIAATALRYSTDGRRVSVVHYDADFESIAAIEPAFVHRWVVSRGSVD